MYPIFFFATPPISQRHSDPRHARELVSNPAITTNCHWQKIIIRLSSSQVRASTLVELQAEECLELHFFVCNRKATSITARLQTRKFGQAPILSQALSSHPHVFIMILWESMNFHPVKQLFQIAGAGARTADPWVTSPTLFGLQVQRSPPIPRGHPLELHLTEPTIL